MRDKEFFNSARLNVYQVHSFNIRRFAVIDNGQVTLVSDCFPVRPQVDQNIRECIIVPDSSLVHGFFMDRKSRELRIGRMAVTISMPRKQHQDKSDNSGKKKSRIGQRKRLKVSCHARPRMFLPYRVKSKHENPAVTSESDDLPSTGRTIQ